MIRSTAATTISDYREAYRATHGDEAPEMTYASGWFSILRRVHGGREPVRYRERDILAMTDRLRAEKARREGQG